VKLVTFAFLRKVAYDRGRPEVLLMTVRINCGLLGGGNEFIIRSEDITF
jgi:hypothetical protein